MKLRHKRTGIIGNLLLYGGRICVWVDNKSNPEFRYDTIVDLSSEWKDYEEPKEYWAIGSAGYVLAIPKTVSPNARDGIL